MTAIAVSSHLNLITEPVRSTSLWQNSVLDHKASVVIFEAVSPSAKLYPSLVVLRLSFKPAADGPIEVISQCKGWRGPH